jgi:hypothetical protein
MYSEWNDLGSGSGSKSDDDLSSQSASDDAGPPRWTDLFHTAVTELRLHTALAANRRPVPFSLADEHEECFVRKCRAFARLHDLVEDFVEQAKMYAKIIVTGTMY